MPFYLFCCFISFLFINSSAAQTTPNAPHPEDSTANLVFTELGNSPVRPLLLSIPVQPYSSTAAYKNEPMEGFYIDDPVQLQAIQETWKGYGEPVVYPFYCQSSHKYLWYQADTVADVLHYYERCQSYSVKAINNFSHLYQGDKELEWKPLTIYSHTPSTYKEALKLYAQLKKNEQVLGIQEEKWMNYEGYLPISYEVEEGMDKQTPKELLALIHPLSKKLSNKKWHLSTPYYSGSADGRLKKMATCYLYCSAKMAENFIQLEQEKWEVGRWVGYDKQTYSMTAFQFHSYWDLVKRPKIRLPKNYTPYDDRKKKAK